MKNNTLESLNNFLFGQLERLDNPEISASELKREIERSKAMTQVARFYAADIDRKGVFMTYIQLSRSPLASR